MSSEKGWCGASRDDRWKLLHLADPMMVMLIMVLITMLMMKLMGVVDPRGRVVWRKQR